MAETENERGISGTYYFRVINDRLPKGVIKRIASLGHEIGYHYEDLDVAQGKMEAAIASFQKNLSLLREIVPIKTICMHGSPMSDYDNRDLWCNHNYRDLGVLAEPYLDIDYTKVLFLTDTGRSWNGARSSIRDKVEVPGSLHRRFQFRFTSDIIKTIKAGKFPGASIITLHPQRWNDNFICWTHEFVWQKVKNVVKMAKVKKSFKQDRSTHHE